ncbi:hypothetical protein CMV_026132 [Castanea mollissima]|uniref:Uncharacterized protein n=1 Tax=Castanea mollissima TaxID=60419 RepID=A0A8J4QHZ1_9ROSI|nr:hypothetical protein CMV_026132 [Castanea mollissima]
MAQRNLISTCLEYKPANCRFLTKVLCIDALLEKHRGYEVLEGAISSVGISDGDRETIKESVDKLKQALIQLHVVSSCRVSCHATQWDRTNQVLRHMRRG